MDKYPTTQTNRNKTATEYSIISTHIFDTISEFSGMLPAFETVKPSLPDRTLSNLFKIDSILTVIQGFKTFLIPIALLTTSTLPLTVQLLKTLNE